MSWKNVKLHYGIDHHTVHIPRRNKNQLLIGSQFIPDLIVIEVTGDSVSVSSPLIGDREDNDMPRLSNLVQALRADTVRLLELIKSPDSFCQSIPIWTYEGSEIIEKRCEKLGWPNVTHDGILMYENEFSIDKTVVVGWAKEYARGKISFFEERLFEAMRSCDQFSSELSTARKDLEKLASLQ